MTYEEKHLKKMQKLESGGQNSQISHILDQMTQNGLKSLPYCLTTQTHTLKVHKIITNTDLIIQ